MAHIEENPDGSFTAQSEDFIDCAFSGSTDYETYDDRDDCWWSGATVAIVYTVTGLDGTHEMTVCDRHVETAHDDLNDPRRAPYLTHVVSETLL